jgi:hypothetical protein
MLSSVEAIDDLGLGSDREAVARWLDQGNGTKRVLVSVTDSTLGREKKMGK